MKDIKNLTGLTIAAGLVVFFLLFAGAAAHGNGAPDFFLTAMKFLSLIVAICFSAVWLIVITKAIYRKSWKKKGSNHEGAKKASL